MAEITVVLQTQPTQINVALVPTAITRGDDGLSAYQLALENGFEGTIEEWLDSLVGADGVSAGFDDIGSFSEPSEITSAIQIGEGLNARTFLAGASGPVVDPTIPDGVPGQTLRLIGTDDVKTVEFNSGTNIKTCGAKVLKKYSAISFDWIPGEEIWLEVSRNEF